MRCEKFAFIASLALVSCAQEAEIKSVPITPPPTHVSLAFKPLFAELLPDSHENLSIGAKLRKPCRGIHTNYSIDNAVIETIVQTAKKHRIVIINEAHNRASHRAFTLRLAKGLKKEGYSIFAAEAFNTPPGQHKLRQDAMHKRGYALKGDGYYIREAVFGQMVSNVLELGYRPIYYEIESSPKDVPRKKRIELRETTQAEHLINRAIEKYPNEKILIHVGFSHGKEIPDNHGNVWMGMRIKQQTGINPLTVSQTACEGGDINQGRLRLKVPNIGSALHTNEGYDMLVLHPPVMYENGRGTWLKEVGRKIVPVPKKLKHPTEWRYIAAHKMPYDPVEDLSDIEVRSTQPVVYDSLLLGPNQKHDLALEPGYYVVASYNDALRLQNTTKLYVK